MKQSVGATPIVAFAGARECVAMLNSVLSSRTDVRDLRKISPVGRNDKKDGESNGTANSRCSPDGALAESGDSWIPLHCIQATVLNE
jgi:hypothetical protein